MAIGGHGIATANNNAKRQIGLLPCAHDGQDEQSRETHASAACPSGQHERWACAYLVDSSQGV